MGYTKITAQVTDQAIQVTNLPKLASGGVNEIQVAFTFCSLWDGATSKTAVFYRDKATVYHVALANDACLAPWEAFATEGTVYMGVFADYSDGTTRTSEVVALEIKQGAITTKTAAANAPDIYAALEARVAALEEAGNGGNSSGNANQGGGITDTARALLISILRNAVFTSDQSASITALNAELANSSSGDSGGSEDNGSTEGGSGDNSGETETTSYTIVNNLTNVENSNTAASVTEGSTYIATLTGTGDYSISSAAISMGGVDITATAWDAATGNITIASVTGDIIITATATIVQTETLEMVYTTSYPNVTTFAYTEKATATQYVVAKQGTIQGGVASVDFDNTVYGQFDINFYVFDADGNPYCQTDKGSSAGNTDYANFSGDMGEIDWEDVGAGSSFGTAKAPFSVKIPDGCTFIACMRRNSANTVYPEGDSNSAFTTWAVSGGITITVTG